MIFCSFSVYFLTDFLQCIYFLFIAVQANDELNLQEKRLLQELENEIQQVSKKINIILLKINNADI
jgi:hypothetical protein